MTYDMTSISRAMCAGVLAPIASQPSRQGKVSAAALVALLECF